jgi:hypothetical protein
MTLKEFKAYTKGEEETALLKIRVVGNQLFVGKKPLLWLMNWTARPGHTWRISTSRPAKPLKPGKCCTLPGCTWTSYGSLSG